MWAQRSKDVAYARNTESGCKVILNGLSKLNLERQGGLGGGGRLGVGGDYFKSKRVLGSENPLECSPILKLTNVSPVKVIVSSWKSYSVWVALEANTDTSVVVSHKQIDNLYHDYAIFQFVVDMQKHQVVKHGLSYRSSRNSWRWHCSTTEGNHH